jgi:hypothetical protein
VSKVRGGDLATEIVLCVGCLGKLLISALHTCPSEWEAMASASFLQELGTLRVQLGQMEARLAQLAKTHGVDDLSMDAPS